MDVQGRSPTLDQAEAWVSMNMRRAALHGSMSHLCWSLLPLSILLGKEWSPDTQTFPMLPPQNLAESTVGCCKLEVDYRRKRQSSRVWYLSSRGAGENQRTPREAKGCRPGSGSTKDLKQTGPLTKSTLNRVTASTAPLFSSVKCGYYLFITGSYMRVKWNNRREGLQSMMENHVNSMQRFYSLKPLWLICCTVNMEHSPRN